MTDELTTRLQSSTSEISLTDAVKAAHLSAISEALQDAPVVPLSPVSRRRRVIATVIAAALIGPTGLAAASGDALPGEPLYGVKQVSEQVTSLFDPDLIARHRIEEAEALAMLGRQSADAITRAADAVADLPEDHALRHRLAALADTRDDDGSEQDPDPDRMVPPDRDDDTSNHSATDSDDNTDDDTSNDGATNDDNDGATTVTGATDDDDVTDSNDIDDAGQPDDSDDFGDDGDDSDSADDTQDAEPDQ